MASIDTGGGDSGHKKGRGVKKAKKLSTRVDMTPMVDLGFLLITFFIFTTTMSSPTTMNLSMPKDTDKPEEQNKAKASGALSIMLGKDNHIFYYEGQLEVTEGKNNFKSSNWDPRTGIRKVIIDKKKEVIANHIHDAKCPEIRERAKKNGDPDWQNADLDRDFVVVIKPSEDASYKNTVDILDEMTINRVKRFALVKIIPEEINLIKATEASGQ
jgi:biopolymer transport protein ExbD